MAVKPIVRQRLFCRALYELNVGHPPGRWTSIDAVAKRMGIDPDEAVVLAVECEQAGLVRHDLSSSATRRRRATAVPHSVMLWGPGWSLATSATNGRKRRR